MLAAASDDEQEQPQEEVGILDGSYRQYRRRWIMLALFCFLSLSNALAWISFAPIAKRTAEFYQVKEHWVSGLAMVYMVCYIGGIWAGAWIIDKKGLQYGVILGGILNLVGALIRLVGANGAYFWAIFLGQAAMGLAQVFILEVPPKLSANWFGQSQRSLATAIGLLANQMGVALGFYLAPFIVVRTPDLPTLLYVEAGICGVASLLALVFFRGEPPSPPSAATDLRLRMNTIKGEGAEYVASLLDNLRPNDKEHSENDASSSSSSSANPNEQLWRLESYQHGTSLPEENLPQVNLIKDDHASDELVNGVTVAWWTRSYWRNVLDLICDRNFLLLMLAFGIAVGAFYSLLVLFVHFTPRNSRQVGVLGMLVLVTGIAGSFVAAMVLDTASRHAFWTKIGFGGLLFSYLWFFVETAGSRSFIMMSFPASCLGFFMAAIFTLCLETGAEYTYPVPEGTTAGLLLLCAQVFGVMFITVMEATRQFAIDAYRSTFAVSNIIMLGALMTSCILILFFKGKNQRQRVEPIEYGTIE